MDDSEDVFDSVQWESPSAPIYSDYTPSAGPGYRQSIDTSEGGPHDPKWEGYLITAVTDPQKELAETKDAYVSYQISAKVCWFLCHVSSQMIDMEECARQIYQCSPLQIQL